MLSVTGNQSLRLFGISRAQLTLLIQVVAQFSAVADVGRRAIQQLIEPGHAVVEGLLAIVNLLGVSADQNPEQCLIGAQHMYIKLARRPAQGCRLPGNDADPVAYGMGALVADTCHGEQQHNQYGKPTDHSLKNGHGYPLLFLLRRI